MVVASGARLVLRASGASLELDGAIPRLHEACEFFGIDRVRRSGTVVASCRVGRNRALLASEQPPDRQARVLSLDVPERDVDAPDGRHDLRPLAARKWRRQAVGSGDASGARAREGEEPVPHRDVGERVHAADDLSEPLDPGADRLHRRAVDLPVAGEAVVGAHFHHDDARCVSSSCAVHRLSFNGTEIGWGLTLAMVGITSRHRGELLLQ